MSFRAGLFNGTVGVAMAAYEVFSREECHKMLSYIGISHIDYLAGIDDYSLYSGLSGIGMALLSLAWLFCHWEHLGTRMKKKCCRIFFPRCMRDAIVV